MSRMLRRFTGLVGLMGLFLASVPVVQHASASPGGGPGTIYVDASAAGANNGTTWPDAYTDLQAALSAAVGGSEIWVAEGTYKPGADRTGTFQLKNGVELYGGFPRAGGDGTMASRDPWRYTTVLSGDIGIPEDDTDNCYHVLTGSGTDSTAILDGFQVTAGYASGLGVSTGGGMVIHSGSPTIRNVIFLRNYAAKFGGALEIANSSPAMENILFHGNRSGSRGGAVDNFDNSHLDINNAVFVGNAAESGGAVNNESSSSLVLRNVTMVSNQAQSSGGAITVDGTSSTILMNTMLWANSPDQIYVDHAGGGTASVDYSIVQDGCPPGATCDSVLADDPLFHRMPSPGSTIQAGPPPPEWGNQDDFYGDLRLESGSPAIDSGNNAMIKPGSAADLMGNPRPADGPETTRTAVIEGGGPVVDRGAYEAPPVPIYVDGSAAGANDGTSWGDALTDLGDAFLWGRSGVVEIWVAEGSYRPGDLRTSTFQLLNGMTVYGGFPAGGGDGTFAARDWEAYSSQLSGDIGLAHVASDNVYHVVSASDVGCPTLDGFWIDGGRADGEQTSQRLGGGIYAPHSHPNLINLSITDNFAAEGGGGAYFSLSEALLSNVTFYSNSTGGSGGGLMLVDGGMFFIGDAAFYGNRADLEGGGLFAAGGHLTANDLDFQFNEAPYGGGIYAGDVSTSLRRVRFAQNSADQQGGGMLVEWLGDVTLTDSVFTANRAGDDGGGLAVGSTSLTLTNVTCSGNSAGGNGGAMDLLLGTSATFHNTILWGNVASGTGNQVYLDHTSALVTDHTIIEDGCPPDATCNHLTTSDPFFYTDPDAGDDMFWGTADDDPGDLRLWKASPAIDAGDNDVRGAPGLDLAHNPRQIDVASVADTGNGTSPIVDIGAYEAPPDVIYVDQTAAGAFSGLTWTDAFTDVQDALAWGLSGPADLWVAQGSYTPGPERDDSFHLDRGIALYGGFPPGGGDGTFEVRDWRAYTTTLSGEIGTPEDRSDNAYHVLVGRNVDQTAKLDGFIITRGSADLAPWISPARVYCAGDSDYGGGLCLFQSQPILIRVAFKDNYALRGGGVELSESSPIMANVEFFANRASAEGGALHSDNSELALINGLFAGNQAFESGGAMWSSDSQIQILNATVSGNHAGAGGALRNTGTTALTATNSIIWGNASDVEPSFYSDEGCNVALDYSLLEGGCPEGADCTHLLTLDPRFVADPDAGGDGTRGTADDDLGDLRLQGSSPAIDAGNTHAFPSTITIDLAGNPRLVDVPSVSNTGSGDPPIDMGAYEFTSAPPVAVDDSYTTAQGTPLTVDAPGVLENDSDPEGDPLSAVKDSDPVSGTLILKADGFFVYTPEPDTTGVMTFTYHAHDGTSSSNAATVAITVTASNVPPTISDLPDQVTRPGIPVGPLSFTIADVETPAAALLLAPESSNTTLVPLPGIVFGGSAASRTVTVTPAAGLTGAATITITVDDGSDTASESFLLTVEPYCIHLPLILKD